jgi:hypothetical protein
MSTQTTTPVNRNSGFCYALAAKPVPPPFEAVQAQVASPRASAAGLHEPGGDQCR